MSGKFNQPEFLARQETEKEQVDARRVARETAPGSAEGHRAEFAWCVSLGRPTLHDSVIPEGVTWHEWVRGNGHSYSMVHDVPETLLPRQGESLREFKNRAHEVARLWEDNFKEKI